MSNLEDEDDDDEEEERYDIVYRSRRQFEAEVIAGCSPRPRREGGRHRLFVTANDTESDSRW